ncbi:unnamed protein product [Calypogeia fissa]
MWSARNGPRNGLVLARGYLDACRLAWNLSNLFAVEHILSVACRHCTEEPMIGLRICVPRKRGNEGVALTFVSETTQTFTI